MTDLESRVDQIRTLLAEYQGRTLDRKELEELRLRLLGRKTGLLSTALRGLGELPAEERVAAGLSLNEVKGAVDEALEALAARLAVRSSEQAPVAHMPTPRASSGGGVSQLPQRGYHHPLRLVADDLVQIFLEMGYGLADGPEIEDEFHNFEALNVPREHPSRDMQDTLYLGPDRLLRTHTSNVQIRTMMATPPPIRIISIGRCYRRDTPDLTHSPQFHQIEGLVVDREVSMAHLKGTLAHLSARMFGSTEVRLRPSYFPFTEPSAELDISCFACAGQGCSMCKGSGYIELGGCGMVDPNVFRAVGIDPEVWSGFAFGFGIERAAMLKYGIDDVRLCFENDLRLLRQFPARL